MVKKITLISLFVTGALLLLTACERSAVPVTPELVARATPTMSLEEAYRTQTAQALIQQFTPMPPGSTGGGEETTPTPEVIQPLPTVAAEPPTPTPLPVFVPTATPGRPLTYTLQPGEFPYCIARCFDVDPKQLLALNGLSAGQIYYPNLVLQIPQTGSFPGERALRPHPDTYTVKANDTIYKIACYYGDVDPMAIAAANNLTAPYTLTPGMTLNIP
ncbi:MAG: LysM peptidoglycan-binding domain-containing protein [Anaerolineales bacterium]|nr:LysM peptidoglycan-binding domain-containing protein [Anaerolineales bacterium]